MARAVECLLTVLSVSLLISTVSVADAAESKAIESKLLSGDRVVLGTIEEIRSDQARTNIGEVEPRFVRMNARKDKALSDSKSGSDSDVDTYAAVGQGQGDYREDAQFFDKVAAI